MRLLVFTFILSTVVEALPGIERNITGVQGGTTILPCKLIDARDHVSQISWRKEPLNDNFLTILPDTGPRYVNGKDTRFQFIGNFKENNGSLQLSNITLTDEGTYTCIITLFPSGSIKKHNLLNVLVPPVISLKDDRPTLGKEEVSLVACMAAGSKPPARVHWLTDTLGEKVKQTINISEHLNGTTTTVSTLFGIPTREINRHLVKCVVTSAAMSKEEILPYTIQIYFSPIEVVISQKSEGSFECVTEANPNANVTWTRSDQSQPPSAVRVEGATLQFMSMTSDLNGLYQCEAANQYGRKYSYLSVNVTSEVCHAYLVLFWLLLLLLIAVGVVTLGYLYKTRKRLRTGEDARGKRLKVPTTSDSPGHFQEEETAVNVEAEVPL